ncbi:MAG: DUF3526 domain-containing protein [Saprospiraceae bacterium]
MRIQTIRLLSGLVWKNKLKSSSTPWLIGIFNVMLFVALFSGYRHMSEQQQLVSENSREVRQQWIDNPDKHPHRMAHYGYVAFRQKFPLSFFDFGMDRYVGNVVFLEAHRQNTVNFSEASLSNGLLRLGEVSAGMILQLLLPLLIFFWGFDLIAREREEGMLRLLLTQGVSWPELIIGKSLGLFYLSLSIFLPAAVIGLILLSLNSLTGVAPQVFMSFLALTGSYLLYLLVLSLLAVFISARSTSSRAALIQLIGCWLFFTLMLPKVSQLVGQQLFPAPSKIEFDTAVEEELIRQGDSHNPDDPHYQALKDSLLAAYGVDATQQLPFNYSGYVMREGERLSAETYRQHQERLVDIYHKQQNVVRLTALFNPYMAVKNMSMAFAGTDYTSFHDFEDQAEYYRYELAQTMNELQIEHIGNQVQSSADKNAIISRKHWEAFPDFQHRFLSFGQMLQKELVSLMALLLWLCGLLTLIFSVKYSVN